MPGLLFVVVCIMFLALGLTPQVRKAYETCYYPIFGRPATEATVNAGWLLTAGFAITFVYALTGGTVSFLLSTESPQQDTLISGVLLGAILFSAARLWALQQSHGFAQSIYFTCLVSISFFLSIGLVRPQIFNELTDLVAKRDQDDLMLLPLCVIASIGAAALSEVLSWLWDHFVSEGPSVPYALTRDQVEAFENYRRVRGQVRMTAVIRNRLLSVAAKAGRAGDKQFVVLWLSTNADPNVGQAINQAVEQYRQTSESTHGPSEPAVQTEVRIVCHDTEANRDSIAAMQVASSRFFHSSGRIRIVIVDRYLALLGVRMGPLGQEHPPDYMIEIREPTRIAQLKSVFSQCWESGRA